MNTAQLEASERVENGPIRFADDWAGVFIRGDNALHFSRLLRAAVDATGDNPILSIQLNGLANLLASCSEPCAAKPVALIKEPTP